MAITAKQYGQAAKGQYSGTAARRVDWAADTIKVALMKEAFTPNQDTDEFWEGIKANELAEAGGYKTGGVALTEKAVSYDAASNTVRLKAANTEWKEASFTAYKAVIYKDTGVAGTSPVLGYIDFGGAETVASGTFKIEWDVTDGVLRTVVA